MWWRKEEQPVVVEGPLVPVPVKTGTLDATEFEKYCAVAESVGLGNSPAIAEEKLRRLLEEEHIHVYNEMSVCRYLHKVMTSGWEWCALTAKDAELDVNSFWLDSMFLVRFSSGPYAQAVPMPVLETVQKIKAKLPEVGFFVSRPREFKGDPFLMVTAGFSTARFIIERWDEPLFRETKTKT